jgi:hypothetical protein
VNTQVGSSEHEPTSFIARNAESLAGLLPLVGIDQRVVDDPEALLAATQPLVRGDHHNPAHKIRLTGDAAVEARGYYGQMELVDERPFSAGKCHRIIVLGAMQRANVLRTSFLAEQLARDDVVLHPGGSIDLWAGPRPLNDLDRQFIDPQVVANLRAESRDAWAENIDPEELPNKTETESLRLAAVTGLGVLTVSRIDLNLASSYGALPPRPVVRDWRMRSSYGRVNLLNTAAVVRPQGEPRHTTEACAEHWIGDSDIPHNARVVLVSGNPYIERTTRVVQTVLNRHGRSDVELVGVGPAAYPDAGDHLFLGEIARNIYEDVRQS